MYNRKTYQRLVRYKRKRKNKSNGSIAVLLTGARHVGKTVIAKEFARNEYKSSLVIDFSDASVAVKRLFTDVSYTNNFISVLQGMCNVVLHAYNSIIILDNADLFPPARDAVRYIIKDGRFDCISISSRSIPVLQNEKSVNVYPLDFEEYLLATGEFASFEEIEKYFYSHKEISSEMHSVFMQSFYTYMLIGGMPEAVTAFNTTHDYSAAESVKENILALYEAEMEAADPTGAVSALFNSIPNQISSNASRFRLTVIPGKYSISELERAVDIAVRMKIALKSYMMRLPSSLHKAIPNQCHFRLFICDTGLLVTMLRKSKHNGDYSIHKQLLENQALSKTKSIHENACAQIITSCGKDLYYYTFPDMISNHNYVIDFILKKRSLICPVILRPSGYTNYTALFEFSEWFYLSVFKRYVLYPKKEKTDGYIHFLPFYALPFIRE